MNKKKRFNIIIPSLTLSSELINCLIKFNDQVYKNFFVTVLLDYKNKHKIPKLKYKLNIIVLGKKTMSYKRNYAVKKFKSDFIAFIDSDAYADKEWLSNGLNLLIKKNKEIIGGPSIPFPNQSFQELMCHYAKRSFFVTGYLNFRKYMAKSRYCDWLESCNLMMNRELFLKLGGMNENIYVGEDKEFIERFKKQDSNIKVFYTPKLFIYHKERNLIKFLLQRMVFGADLYNITNFNYKIRSFQSLLPLITFITFISIFFLIEDFYLKFKILIFFISIIQISILINLIKYIKNPKKLLIVLFIVNLANIAYVVGNLFQFIGIKRFLNRKIYLKSRNNK